MATTIGSILRASSRKKGDALNILTCPTHERYQNGWSNVNANFYMIQTPSVKTWNSKYGDLPKNHILLNASRGEKQLPLEVDFDLVLSQNKFGQIQILSQIAHKLHLPIISLEHTLPMETWPKQRLEDCKNMKGDLNVFISDFSREKWGWSKEDSSVRVIEHGVDTELFYGWYDSINRESQCLSVVNDWINRDWCCGFNFWREGTKGLPVKVLGDTPGLSSPAKTTDELVYAYQNSQIFINTSLVSPIPTALLEAMSCCCACISTRTCMIPSVIEHERNGILVDTPEELNKWAKILLQNRRLCASLGIEARKTILERFSMKRFVQDWTKLFEEASNLTYGI